MNTFYHRQAHIFLCLIGLFAGNVLHAQTNASPYSIVGIGDIEQSYADHSAGMADAGVSLSSGRYLYHSNPASYSALDDHFFSLELSGRLKAVTYYGNNVSLDNNRSTDMQMARLAAAIKLKKFWGASVGLMPYSSSNYSFYNTKYIDGTYSSVQAHYDGTGGVYQFYVGNGFSLGKHLSVGLQASVLFGSLMQNETLLTSIVTDSIVTTRSMYVHKVVPKLGFQYKANLSKDLKFSLGATASPSSDLHTDYTVDVRQGSNELVTDKSVTGIHFTLPFSYAGGASVVYRNAFTVSAEYSAQQWSDATYSGLGYSLTSSNRMAAGFQYANQKKYYNQVYENYYVQGGAYYGNTYLVVNGQQLTDKGFTLGIGSTAKRSGLGYQLNLQIGTKGAQSSSVLKENYTRASFTLYYRDLWYTKYKKYN